MDYVLWLRDLALFRVSLIFTNVDNLFPFIVNNVDKYCELVYLFLSSSLTFVHNFVEN
jgi:hypothetical protein